MKRAVPLLALLSILTATVAATDDKVCHLRIRPCAAAEGGVLTVADVVDLKEADAELRQAIGTLKLTPTLAARGKRIVDHEQIVRCLDAANVNLGRVLLSGAARCEIVQSTRTTATTASNTPGSHATGTPFLRSTANGTPNGARTLADVIRDHIDAELAELGGKANLQFDRAGEEFLGLTTPPWDFRVTSSGTNKLGLREFRVLIRRDGRVQDTVRIYAHVQMSCQVVIARRPLSIGNYIRHDDVEIATHVFDSTAALGLQNTGEVIGQQVKKFIPKGEMVLARNIKAMDLVRRSRPVTVIGAADAVHVRLTGVALDSAGYGESVRVRLGESRGSRQQIRGVVTGLGTVRLVEDQP